MTRGASHSGGRRPKSATARSRGKFGGGGVERYATLASQPRVGTPNSKPPPGTRRRVGGTFSGSGAILGGEGKKTLSDSRRSLGAFSLDQSCRCCVRKPARLRRPCEGGGGGLGAVAAGGEAAHSAGENETSMGRPALKQVLPAVLRRPAGAGEMALPGAARTLGLPRWIDA
jgi:hypothetical protein